MKHTRKSYETPILKVLQLNSSPLLVEVASIESTHDGTTGDHGDSKAFWGPSLFDDEDEEEYVDDILP